MLHVYYIYKQYSRQYSIWIQLSLCLENIYSVNRNVVVEQDLKHGKWEKGVCLKTGAGCNFSPDFAIITPLIIGNSSIELFALYCSYKVTISSQLPINAGSSVAHMLSWAMINTLVQ